MRAARVYTAGTTWREFRARTWGRIRRHPRVRRLVYDLVSLVFFRDRSLQTLNCGYLPANESSDKPVDRLGLGIYELLAAECDDWSVRHVIEAGCGRGGGSAFFMREYRPLSLTAVDFSRASIRYCRSAHRGESVRFVRGNALHLPFPDAVADCLISIELSHCVDNKVALLHEWKRVLKPGGFVLIADFYYLRESAPNALATMEKALAESGLTVRRTHDLTQGVLAALESASPGREALIQKRIPRFLHSIAHDFSMTRRSSAFRGFAEGRTVYRLYVVEKPGKLSAIDPT